MKKQGILNSHIAKVLADLSHTDTIVVGDVGLPVPPGSSRLIWPSSMASQASATWWMPSPKIWWWRR